MLQRTEKVVTARRYCRVLVALALAVAAVAGSTVSVNAQWPTGCVELNDIVEQHLGNVGNVGIYQRLHGEQAEATCRADHRADVQSTFAWAFTADLPAVADEGDAALEAFGDADGWPETCVQLNDIVEGQLGNDQNVGIYQRAFGEQAEAGCRQDHADDVREVFGWAAPCEARASEATSSITTVLDLAGTDATLQRMLLNLPWISCHVYPWLADGMSDNDRQALQMLQRIAKRNRDLGSFIATADWFADGVADNQASTHELRALRHLDHIAEMAQPISQVMTTYPWLADQLTHDEVTAVQAIFEMSQRDLVLAITVATSPWIRDGIFPHEPTAIADLDRLAQVAPHVADNLLRESLHTYGTPRSHYSKSSSTRAFTALVQMYFDSDVEHEAGERFGRVLDSWWYRTGLTVRDVAFFVALAMVRSEDDDLFDGLLRHPTSEFLEFTLPLRGSFRLQAFQDDSFPSGESSLITMADALRGAEQFMGVPLPFDDIVVLYGGNERVIYDDGRVHFPRTKPVRILREEVYRAVGELYFSDDIGPNYPSISSPNPGWNNSRPRWMAASAPGFVGAVASDWAGASNLAHVNHLWARAAYPMCPEHQVASIHAAAVRVEPDSSEEQETIETCIGLFGRMLLYQLLLILGEERMSAAMRELYLISADARGKNEEGIEIPSEKDIFRIFLKHTPPDRVDEMRHWYRYFHGGPFINAVN